jgi:hypothetical protein
MSFFWSNLAHGSTGATSIAPGTYTAASTKGTGIDTAGSNRSDIVIALGAWTDGAQLWKIQVSDDDVDGNYANAPLASLDYVSGVLNGSGFLAVTDATKDGKVYVVAYTGSKRWIRVVTEDTGGTTGGAGAAFVFLTQSRYVGTNPGSSTNFDSAYNPTS